MATTNGLQVTRAERKAAGIYYTVPAVVRYIVGECIRHALAAGRTPESLRVLDPACGDGVFLAEAIQHLAGLRGCALDDAAQQVYGVDVDPAAIRAARERVMIASCDDRSLRHGDAPRCPQAPPAADTAPPIDWHRGFPRVDPQGFDVVVGNPPYVNIRTITRTHGPAVKEYFSRQFLCARKAYDLYVLFLELALRLLRPGGVCGMIVPNKLAEMEYAEACRRLLLEQTTLLEIVDVTRLKLFATASVFPYIVIFRKSRPPAGHAFAVRSSTGATGFSAPQLERTVPQHAQSARRGFDLHGRLDLESRVATEPMADRADLSSGTTGFSAGRVARAVVEQESIEREFRRNGLAHKFIVSKNIDRFAIRTGDVRFMKRRYRDPVIPADSESLSAGKRQLFRAPKIVVAGMTQRLEAAWDSGGLALGVQVYAVRPVADDPFYVLAPLNSKLMSYLFRLRFQAKRLSGGYYAVNKRQLSELPIRVQPECHREAVRLAVLARQLLDMPPAERTGRSGTDCDAEIDRLVYRLYRISDSEIKQIETEIV